MAWLDSCAIKGLAMKTNDLLKEDIELLKRLWSWPGINIRKNTAGTKLYLRFRVPTATGSTQHSWTYPSWDAAVDAGERITADLARGRMPVRERALFPPTIDEAAEHYRVTRIKGGVSRSTLDADAVAIRMLKDVVACDIGSPVVRIAELAPQHSIAFVNELERRGRKTSTIQGRWSLARQFWGWAASWYHGKHDVCPAPPLKVSQTAEEMAQSQLPIPTYEMIGAAAPFLVGNASLGRLRKETPSNALWSKAFVLMWGLGIRRTQACALQWGDIDWDNQRVRIQRNCKSKSEAKMRRWIATPEWLLEIVSGWDRRALQLVTTTHKGRLRVALDANEEAKITQAASRVWESVGLPQQFYKHQPTHNVRKAFRTGVHSIAGHSYHFNTITLSDLLEYQLGHATGLVGIYTDMWEAFTQELRFIAKACPDVRTYAKGVRGSSGVGSPLVELPSIAEIV